MSEETNTNIDNRVLCSSIWAKIAEQIERTGHLIGLTPHGCMDWTPPIAGAWPAGMLLGHLLDCLAGFCAALCAVAPERLAGLEELRKMPVNFRCSPSEAAGRVAAYRASIEEGFAAITDKDLRIKIPTVFVTEGETLLTLLLGNLEHLINHKHQLFMYLKLMGTDVRSADLYHFRTAE